jgi:membrane-associated phospholipid phosphatase
VRRAGGALQSFDATCDRAFDRLRGRPLVQRLFYAASALGDHSALWLALGALQTAHRHPGACRSGARRKAGGWTPVARLAGGLALESALVNGAIKSAVGRHRPPAGPSPLYLRTPRTSSFPSGHASAAACSFVLLSEGDRAWPLYLALAGLVTASRIYVGLHHTSDVLAGLAIGTAVGLALRRSVPLHPPVPPESSQRQRC